MINPELLEVLACPETKQPVRLADQELIDQLNQRIEKGEVKNRAGKPVNHAIDGGLLREDGKILYPIVDDIPVMLIDEGIEIEAM